jgi:regulator of sigma E protease
MIHILQSAALHVIPLLVVITVIVTVHELGHFLVARACGVAVERFSIGFGPTLFAWRDRSGVEWRVAAWPLGGYVRFALDENIASVPDHDNLEAMRASIQANEGPGAEQKYLPFKPLWQRAIISLAGPGANFILALVLFSLLFSSVGAPQTPYKIKTVEPNSPAAWAGFKPDDRIVSANGHLLPGFMELQSFLAYRYNVPMDFVVRRGAETIHLEATPRAIDLPTGFGWNQTAGQLGVGITSDGPWVRKRLDPLSAMVRGADETWEVFSTNILMLSRLATGQASLGQLHGVVGMDQAAATITKRAIDAAPGNPADQVAGVAITLVTLAAEFSIGIGIMNLLPLPVLDGGHLVFYAYEWLAKRPLAAQVQMASYRVGLALLAGLMLFANLHDLPLTRVFHFLGTLFS